MSKFELFVMNSPLRAMAQEIVEIRGLKEWVTVLDGKTVLEIGCGNGTGTKLIKRYFHPKKIYGIDNDPTKIALAKARVKDQSIVFSVGDAAKLPYKDNTFDIVFDFSVIYHIAHWKSALKEVKRVIKPGGQFILEDLTIETFGHVWGKAFRRLFMHTYKRPYQREEFLTFLRLQGWRITTKRVFHPLGFEYFIVIAGKPEVKN